MAPTTPPGREGDEACAGHIIGLLTVGLTQGGYAYVEAMRASEPTSGHYSTEEVAAVLELLVQADDSVIIPLLARFRDEAVRLGLALSLVRPPSDVGQLDLVVTHSDDGGIIRKMSVILGTPLPIVIDDAPHQCRMC